jgi:hypothetical protein
VNIGDLIRTLENHPDICGLEEVLLDNLMNQPANVFDSRVQDRRPILLVYHEPSSEKSMPVHKFVAGLKRTVGVYKLTLDSPMFVDDIISLPKPIPVSVDVGNGVVYLRFVEL